MRKKRGKIKKVYNPIKSENKIWSKELTEAEKKFLNSFKL